MERLWLAGSGWSESLTDNLNIEEGKSFADDFEWTGYCKQ
jgi:hypothetical protein